MRFDLHGRGIRQAHTCGPAAASADSILRATFGGDPAAGIDNPAELTSFLEQDAKDLGSIQAELQALECNSFTATTKVLLANGKTIPIEAVKVGDVVEGTDATDWGTGPHKVTAVIKHNGPHRMVDITIAGGGILHATDRHPFWDETTQRFTDAIDIRAGDRLREANGTSIQVLNTRTYGQNLTAYNLTVDGVHTYYVVARDTPVLVHNASCTLPGWDNLADGKQVGKVKVVDNVTDLRTLFDNWTQGGTRLPARGPKIPDVFQLPDGTVVQWRTASASGGETIDVFSGADQFKVHIDGH